jgi:uncharacterized alkaline shock family protein YloU
MNVFNRLLLILLALTLLMAVVAVLLATTGVVSPDQLAPTTWLQDRLRPFVGLENPERGWTVGVCMALAVLGLVLLFLELKPSRNASRMTLTRDELGRVTVDRDGIAALVNREATQVPGVMESRAEVAETKGRVRIRERVSVDPAAPLPELTQAVRTRVKDAVEYHLGRPVAGVRVDTQVRPFDPRQRVR